MSEVKGQLGQHVPTASISQATEFMQSRVFETMLDLNLSDLPIGVSTDLVPSTSADAAISFAVEHASEASYELRWTPSPSLRPSHNVRSAADLYWIEPKSKQPVFFGNTVGTHLNTWPCPEARSLGISFTAGQLDDLKRPGFDWRKPQRYLARLFFYSDRLNKEEPATISRNDLTATRALSSHISNPQPNDVQFIFKRRNKGTFQPLRLLFGSCSKLPLL